MDGSLQCKQQYFTFIQKMLNELKAIGKYTRMARHHKYSGVHSGPAFLLWHREFIKRSQFTNWLLKDDSLPNRFSFYNFLKFYKGLQMIGYGNSILNQYKFRCEIVFRKHMPIEDVNMGIPYWDSSLDWPLPTPSDSIFFSDIFVGEVR